MRMTRWGYNARSLSLSEVDKSFFPTDEPKTLEEGGERARTEVDGEVACGSVGDV